MIYTLVQTTDLGSPDSGSENRGSTQSESGGVMRGARRAEALHPGCGGIGSTEWPPTDNSHQTTLLQLLQGHQPERKPDVTVCVSP